MEKLAIVVPCYNEEEVLKIASEVNPSYDYDFASEMMERFELDGKKKFNHLSLGMKTMVSTIICLASSKDVILLDEPVLGFDAIMRVEFYDMLTESFKKHPRIIIVSTHIIEDVQSVCDQIVVIHQGRILFAGTPEALIQTAAGHVGVFWERDAAQEQGLPITARVNTSRGVRCRAVTEVLPAYAQPEEPTLEDAYLYLISREAVQ